MRDNKRTIVIAIVAVVILGPAAYFLTAPKKPPAKVQATASTDTKAKPGAQAKESVTPPKSGKAKTTKAAVAPSRPSEAPANKGREAAKKPSARVAAAKGEWKKAAKKPPVREAAAKGEKKEAAKKPPAREAKAGGEEEKTSERGGVAAAPGKAGVSVAAVPLPKRDPFARIGAPPPTAPTPQQEQQPQVAQAPTQPQQVPPILTTPAQPSITEPGAGQPVAATSPAGYGPQNFATTPPPGLWFPRSLPERSTPPGKDLQLVGTVRGARKAIATFRYEADGTSRPCNVREGDRVGSGRTKVQRIKAGQVVLSNDFTHQVVPVKKKESQQTN